MKNMYETNNVWLRKCCCLGGVLLLLCLKVNAADISVMADRNPASLDESFNLIFIATEEVDNDPDFSPLENDFEVLGTQKTSQFSYINGKTSREKKWTVTLLPKHSGEIAIPAIAFGKDRSPSLALRVKESGVDSEKGREIFLEVETSSDEVFVQQQLGVVVRLFRSVATANADLSELTVSGVNSLVERLAEGAQYHTKIDGETYQVFERRYVVFPQESGDMTINQVLFKATKGGFANPFGGQPKSIIRRSEEKTVRIKPVPTVWQGDVWLPAQSLQLDESWANEPSEFRVGEPVTRTVTLKGRGLLASQLPEIDMGLPDGIKAYPDQPELINSSSDRDVVGVRKEKVALIPSQAGTITLPAIRIPYWSVEDNETRYAEVPERTIEVLPAANVTGAPTEPVVNVIPRETMSASPEPGDVITTVQTDNTDAALWQWLSGLFLFAWLITLYLLWRNRQTAPQPHAIPHERIGQLIRAVQSACEEDNASACKYALLKWAAARWPESPPRSLGELGVRMDADMKAYLDDLNQVLYSKEKITWNGNAFWRIFETSSKQADKPGDHSSNPLEPLYRMN